MASVDCYLYGSWDIDGGIDLSSLYDINLQKTLTAYYDIKLQTTTSAYYDVKLQTSYVAYYDILANKEWNWVVQVRDKSYTHRNFYNGKLIRKLQQVHTFSAVFHDLTSTDLSYYIVQGKDLRVLVNDRIVFSGEITRVIKNDTSNTWTVECNSLAIKLRNKKITTKNEWVSQTADTIIKAILPATSWEGTIDTGPYIDYKSEYSDILEQVSNICQSTNFEWDCRESYSEIDSTALEDLGSDKAKITFTGSFATDLLVGKYCFAITNSIKNYGGYITTNTGSEITLSSVALSTPFCYYSSGDSGTKFRIYREPKLDYKDYIGRSSAADTLKIGREVIYAERTNDTSRIQNKIIVPGQSSGSESFTSVYSANTTNLTEVAYSEAYLTNECTASDTTLRVSSTTALPAIGMVYVESEQIHYAAKTSTTLTGCARGMNSTTAAIHTYGAPVVSRDYLPALDTSLFGNTGHIMVGMEEIEYQSKDASGFWDLTRGHNSSTMYNHAAGIHIRDSQYTDASPQTGSSIADYGVIDNVMPSKGGQSRNTLDFYAQSQCTIKGSIREWGTVKVVGPSLRNELTYGDRVYIEERASTTTTLYRIMGMTWDMMRATIILEFGDTEEWILEKLSNLDRIQQQATIKPFQPTFATATQVSSSGKTAYVTLDSGEMKIVRIS